MKSITRIGLGLGAAAVVASGGSAFTASNSSTESQLKMGYKNVDVTGVSISNIAYQQLSSDISVLDKVVFTVGDDVRGAGYAIKLTLNGPTGTVTVCTATAATTISCDISDVAYDTVDSVQLNVSPT